jgi:hypothetical protein
VSQFPAWNAEPTRLATRQSPLIIARTADGARTVTLSTALPTADTYAHTINLSDWATELGAAGRWYVPAHAHQLAIFCPYGGGSDNTTVNLAIWSVEPLIDPLAAADAAPTEFVAHHQLSLSCTLGQALVAAGSRHIPAKPGLTYRWADTITISTNQTFRTGNAASYGGSGTNGVGANGHDALGPVGYIVVGRVGTATEVGLAYRFA